MGWRLDKTKAELKALYQEVVVENGHRYRDPLEWGHLWVDFWGAACEHAPYTFGHILAFTVPVVIAALVTLLILVI
jgi:hypothetical protein